MRPILPLVFFPSIVNDYSNYYDNNNNNYDELNWLLVCSIQDQNENTIFNNAHCYLSYTWLP